MCGIIAFLSNNEKIDTYSYILRGLAILQNRGYDSAGICTLSPEFKLLCTKFASGTILPLRGSTHSMNGMNVIQKLQMVEFIEAHKGSMVGIGHTRWATHGKKNDANSHPHIDMSGRIAVVHNGIIENYATLKKMLEMAGYKFKSTTDTEVVANLISYNLDKEMHSAIQLKGPLNIDLNSIFMTALKRSTGTMEGTWSLAILYLNMPTRLYVCKNGSPLLLGLGLGDDKCVAIASEVAGFHSKIDKYFALNDRDVFSVGLDNINKIFGDKGDKLLNIGKTREGKNVVTATTPHPYKHWMIREISEQPMSIRRTFASVKQDLLKLDSGPSSDLNQKLRNIENLLILACGTSYHAGLVGEMYFKELAIFNTIATMDAADFTLADLPKEGAGVLVLSQSGETKDVHRAMELVKALNQQILNYNNKHYIPIIGIVNVKDSLIATESDYCLYLDAGREVAVASTKSFTSQIVAVRQFAKWFRNKAKQQQNITLTITSKNTTQYINDENKLVNQITEVIQSIATSKQFAKLISGISDIKNCFILGKHYARAIALEASLKIKEIAYIHAEGYSGGALKHGPFALIEDGMVIFLIILRKNPDDVKKMESVREEVKARGAKLVIVTDLDSCNSNNDDIIIKIPYNSDTVHSAILATIPFQILAYQLALKKEINPDFPRNLAKCVTTD